MVSWIDQYSVVKSRADTALKAIGKAYSHANMATLLDVSRGKVQAWEKGQRPSADDLEALAKAFKLSPRWLLLGEGEPEETLAIRRLGDHAPACVLGPDEAPAGQVVPVYGMAAGGNGLECWEPEPIAHVCVPLTYYRESIMVVQVQGRSMEPTIRHGAFVGIDTAQLDYIPGEIYGLRVPYEGLTIKQLFIDPAAGRYRLRSINPEHPEMHLPIDERSDLVVGKVAWVLQKL